MKLLLIFVIVFIFFVGVFLGFLNHEDAKYRKEASTTTLDSTFSINTGSFVVRKFTDVHNT